ncbi:MAG: hypothetical protein H6981_05960 [Gammaproteobacteria bacterium]|nr:hypothetical protein [Gammaproteobacteria bacterium]MCP5136328.1 hypothetical protein [Gammaproteobacteria bacterium]
MFYLLSELLIYLVLAAALGFLLGWLERGKRGLGDLEGRVKREAQNTRNEHSALNNKIATVEAKLDHAKSDVLEARAAADKAGKDADAARAELLKARTEAEAIRGELDAAESRNGSLQAEASDARKQADSAAAELASTKQQIGKLEKELAQAKQAPAKAKDDIRSLEADLEAAQVELAAAREEMESSLGSKPSTAQAPAKTVAKAAARKPTAKPAATASKTTTAKASTKDDLKLIKGIGPVLEKKLNAMGIHTYAQIANMKAADLAKINEQLNFKDRHIRDDWQGKAAKAHQEKYGKAP